VFVLPMRVVLRPGFGLLRMHDLADQLAPIFTFRTHTRVGSEPLTFLRPISAALRQRRSVIGSNQPEAIPGLRLVAAKDLGNQGETGKAVPKFQFRPGARQRGDASASLGASASRHSSNSDDVIGSIPSRGAIFTLKPAR
jgi:hypothetical protein